MMKSMFKSIWIMLLVLTSLYMANNHASEEVDIYQVSMPVTDQTLNTRSKAIEQGLNKVLIRASGLDSVLGNQYISDNISKARTFIQKFSYQVYHPIQPLSDDKLSENSPITPWELVIDFEPGSVQRLLSEAGLPVWGKRRPVVLVWIAEQEGLDRKILSSDSDSAKLLTALSQDRGIPFSLPLMDLEDSTQIEMTDIWGRFSAPVEQASKRYAADVVVLGRVYSQGSNQWQADWQFVMNKDGSKKRAGWDQTAPSRTKIYQQLMSELGRKLCSQYCVMPTLSDEAEMRISISELQNFQQAMQAEQYLQSLLPVRAVNIEILSVDRVIFKLHLVSREEDVLEAISLDTALKNLPNYDNIGAEKTLYNFSWVK